MCEYLITVVVKCVGHDSKNVGIFDDSITQALVVQKGRLQFLSTSDEKSDFKLL